MNAGAYRDGKGRSRGLASAGFVSMCAMLAWTFGVFDTKVQAQSYEQLRIEREPLELAATGSFYVAGRAASESEAQVGLYAGGTVAVDQMYVQYMIPKGRPEPAVVFIHGGTLTGKSFETTPDGRMGWYEYFARKGFRSFVVDQVGRGRSGFDQAIFNDVRAGVSAPKSQPQFRRIAGDIARVRFRIGTEDGRNFADTQFPIEAASALANQTVPDLAPSSSSDAANYRALSILSGQLQHAILIGHSQAGRFPIEAALVGSAGIRGLVAIEPTGCNSATYTEDQIERLAKKPMLIVFGDHLDAPQRYGMQWTDAYSDCLTFVNRINASKGHATLLHIPDLGIRGNSHMMMQDRNNLQIADLIIRWIRGLSL